MKAIVASGWTPSLIPDDYIKNAFLREELQEIDALEVKAAELESELSGMLDEVEMDENGEDENGKAIRSVKSYLKEQIADLKAVDTESAKREKRALESVH